MPSSVVSQRRTAPPNALTSTLRIASLLPGLTDLVHDLNLSHHLVATSHECDYPTTATPITRSKLVTSHLTPLEITTGWNALALHPLRDALSTRICSFYTVDVEALTALRPNVLLTHLIPPRDLDPSHEDIIAALESLIQGIKIINANPTNLQQIYQLYHQVADYTHTTSLMPIINARARLRSLSLLPIAKRPRIAVVQWTEPLYLAGEWVSEVVSLCAKSDGLTYPGSPSVSVHPSALRNVDIIIFAICALDIHACSKVIKKFWSSNHHIFSNWSGRLICADATRLFSRVALPVVVTSAEVVAEVVMNDDRYGHKGISWTDWQSS